MRQHLATELLVGPRQISYPDEATLRVDVAISDQKHVGDVFLVGEVAKVIRRLVWKVLPHGHHRRVSCTILSSALPFTNASMWFAQVCSARRFSAAYSCR